MNNKNQIEDLINAGNLAEAMELLKPAFSEKSVNKDVFKILYRIVATALAKGDVKFAATVATYGEGWFGYIEVPKEASWDAIIHQALQQGGFPDIGVRTDFLVPHLGSYLSAPEKLNTLGVKAWEFFKDHDWNIPGFEVKFDAYMSRGSDYIKPLFAYRVAEIRGKDFLLGFHGVQGLIDSSWNYDLNNTGGFNFIAADKCVLEFYSDHSGPAAWEYTGDDWEGEVAMMSAYSSFYDKPNWKEVDCRVPAHNQVFMEFLFDPKGNYDAVQSKRKSGAENREYLLSRVETALENDIMPKIIRSTISPSKQQVTISAKQMANSVFGRKRPEGHDDVWQHVIPTFRR